MIDLPTPLRNRTLRANLHVPTPWGNMTTPHSGQTPGKRIFMSSADRWFQKTVQWAMTHLSKDPLEHVLRHAFATENMENHDLVSEIRLDTDRHVFVAVRETGTGKPSCHKIIAFDKRAHTPQARIFPMMLTQDAQAQPLDVLTHTQKGEDWDQLLDTIRGLQPESMKNGPYNRTQRPDGVFAGWLRVDPAPWTSVEHSLWMWLVLHRLRTALSSHRPFFEQRLKNLNGDTVIALRSLHLDAHGKPVWSSLDHWQGHSPHQPFCLFEHLLTENTTLLPLPLQKLKHTLLWKLHRHTDDLLHQTHDANTLQFVHAPSLQLLWTRLDDIEQRMNTGTLVDLTAHDKIRFRNTVDSDDLTLVSNTFFP